MSVRAFLSALLVTLAFAAPHDAGAAPALPSLPRTVGMSGPDVDLIESGIAAFDRGDLARARDDFRKALAIRGQTAVANFDYGVVEVRLGRRDAGAAAMRRGFALAREHGMAASPQAGSMRAIARVLDIVLD
jgi:Flp pilus assembly protein TadD